MNRGKRSHSLFTNVIKPVNNGVKLDEQTVVYWKKNIKNKNFNKEGRLFEIFLVVYSAHCTLSLPD